MPDDDINLLVRVMNPCRDEISLSTGEVLSDLDKLQEEDILYHSICAEMVSRVDESVPMKERERLHQLLMEF